MSGLGEIPYRRLISARTQVEALSQGKSLKGAQPADHLGDIQRSQWNADAQIRKVG